MLGGRSRPWSVVQQPDHSGTWVCLSQEDNARKHSVEINALILSFFPKID